MAQPVGQLAAAVGIERSRQERAHFERRLIVERTRDGLSAARARGKVFGRPPLDPDTLASAPKLIEAGVYPAQAAKQLGLGRWILYRELPLLRRSKPSTPMLDEPGGDGRADAAIRVF